MIRAKKQVDGSDKATTASSRAGDAFKRALYMTAVAFLAFVSGGVTIFLDIQPVTGYLQKTAMVALYLYKSGVEGEAIDPFWHRAHLPGPANDNPVAVDSTKNDARPSVEVTPMRRVKPPTRSSTFQRTPARPRHGTKTTRLAKPTLMIRFTTFAAGASTSASDLRGSS